MSLTKAFKTKRDIEKADKHLCKTFTKAIKQLNAEKGKSEDKYIIKAKHMMSQTVLNKAFPRKLHAGSSFENKLITQTETRGSKKIINTLFKSIDKDVLSRLDLSIIEDICCSTSDIAKSCSNKPYKRILNKRTKLINKTINRFIHI